MTVHRTLWWWSTPESVVAKIINVLPITVFVHYISRLYSYIYCYAIKWQFSMILYVGYVIFCNIKTNVHSHMLWNDVKLSLIWFSQWSAYIIIHLNTLNKLNNLIKTRFTHCRMSVLRRQSSHHRAKSVSNAARSRRPCVAVSSSGADTWEKNNKRPLQSARCVTTLKRAGAILTYAHIPSPHSVNGTNPTATRSRLH